MNYTRIILFITISIIAYYIFLHIRDKKIELPIKLPIEKVDNVIEDITQHNKLVLTQINDYIEKQSIPNYTQESISAGTLKLMDIHDIY